MPIFPDAQRDGQDPGPFQSFSEDAVSEALNLGCQSIAYTYTEPTVFLDTRYHVARLARRSGLKNVFVSNGYTGREAAEKIIPILDGINIDLKGDDQFYLKVCGARLEPVQQNIELFWKKGVWVEVTTLLIPGYNDSGPVLKEAGRLSGRNQSGYTMADFRLLSHVQDERCPADRN